jgi:preprotein translocase subunit SecB
MINKAAFSFEKYTFNKVEIDFDSNNLSELEIDFSPSGIFKQTASGSVFELKFIFSAKDKETSAGFVLIECNSTFRFASNIQFEEIPSFFYANSIAIVFPYIRAFVSTVTLQANFPPIVLPTMNLSSLEEPLRKHTKEL